MNYERHLFAITMPGEIGNCYAVIQQTSKEIHLLKLSVGGSSTLTINPKKFKNLISEKKIELIEKIPTEVVRELKNAYKKIVTSKIPE